MGDQVTGQLGQAAPDQGLGVIFLQGEQVPV